MESGTFAVDQDTRTIRGILIPWGEKSRTSASKTKPITFARGSVTLPRDPAVASLNLEHDRFSPLGRGARFEDQETGLYAEFVIADTDEGDAWLADHGTFVKLSAEVRDIERDEADFGTAKLTGAALVTEGAFASAALFAIDAEPDDEDDEAVERGIDETTDDSTESDGRPDEEPDETEGEAVPEASASEVMLAGRAKPTEPALTKRAYFRMLDEVMGGRASFETRTFIARTVQGEGGMFALDDIAYDGVGGVGAEMVPAQWIGEVEVVSYRPIYSDLFPTKPLTSLSLGGWKWGTKPAGDTWTGNKADVPSNTPTVTPVTETASRWAGGHDIAREHRDFGTPGFFEAYNAAMRESYEQWKDVTIVRTELLAGATDVEADNPSGLTIGAGWSALIDGAAAVVAAGFTPTFAVVELSLWKAMMKVPDSDTIGYLEASLNLESGSLSGFTFRPASGLTTGHILIGSREAADVYQLPGSPVRAEALNISAGGIDVGLFGYAGLLIKDATGIVDVAPYTP